MSSLGIFFLKEDDKKFKKKTSSTLRYWSVTVTLSLRFSDDECDEMFRLANADDDGNFNYLDFVKTIKHGAKDD